ncbi:MAG TPA: methyltransferase domain-containing protein [Trichormus sp.]
MSNDITPASEVEAVDYFSIRHPLRRVASVASLRARRKMFQRFMQLINPLPTDRIVDIGVTPDATLPESNFFEEMYPHTAMITATSIEDASFLERKHPGLNFVRTGPDRLPFEDGAFDVAVSFAVLEHVGTRSQQERFVQELLRVSKKVFLTTPDKSFPLEIHTFVPLIHWLPTPQHQALLRALGMEFWAKTENLNLLSGGDLLKMFGSDRPVKLYRHRLLGFSANLIVASDCREC